MKNNFNRERDIRMSHEKVWTNYLTVKEVLIIIIIYCIMYVAIFIKLLLNAD